jgi:hypothetical protein
MRSVSLKTPCKNIDSLPKAGIIGETDKIADMRWIWKFFRALIIPES